MKTKKANRQSRRNRSGRRVRLPTASVIKELLKYYRMLCECHHDPKVQRIAQGMEAAIRYATETTRGLDMYKEPILLAQCLRDDLKIPGNGEAHPRRQ